MNVTLRRHPLHRFAAEIYGLDEPERRVPRLVYDSDEESSQLLDLGAPIRRVLGASPAIGQEAVEILVRDRVDGAFPPASSAPFVRDDPAGERDRPAQEVFAVPAVELLAALPGIEVGLLYEVVEVDETP
jgi:hypothetical protein